MWRIPSPLLSASSASHHFSLSRRFGVAWRGVAWRLHVGVALRCVAFTLAISLSRARALAALLFTLAFFSFLLRFPWPPHFASSRVASSSSLQSLGDPAEYSLRYVLLDG